MRQEFNEIYNNLFADYIYESDINRARIIPYGEFELAKMIRRTIDRSDLNGLLRSDARYFLLVNFHHLILRPIIENNKYRGTYEPNRNIISLEQAIESDIQTIVNESIESYALSNTSDNQISGHQIMGTINRIWTQLKTTSFEIWG